MRGHLLGDNQYLKILSSEQFLSCSSGGKVGFTQYGRAYSFFDLSNAQTMNAALVATVYSKLITPQPVATFVSV